MSKLPLNFGTLADYLKWLADAVEAEQNAVQERMRLEVACREKGAKWTELGAVMGLTGEGVAKRYPRVLNAVIEGSYTYQTTHEKQQSEENDTP